MTWSTVLLVEIRRPLLDRSHVVCLLWHWGWGVAFNCQFFSIVFEHRVGRFIMYYLTFFCNMILTHCYQHHSTNSLDLVTDTFTGTYAFVIIGPITFKCLCYGDFCSWILNYYVNLVCIEWKHSSYMRVFFLCNRMTVGTLSLELPIKRQIQQQQLM